MHIRDLSGVASGGRRGIDNTLIGVRKYHARQTYFQENTYEVVGRRLHERMVRICGRIPGGADG